MVDLSKMTKWDMGKLFDFSVLPKQSTEADIRRGCQIAKEYNCKAFCFSSSEWTPIVAEELKGTDIMVGAAIGFPFGQQFRLRGGNVQLANQLHQVSSPFHREYLRIDQLVKLGNNHL